MSLEHQKIKTEVAETDMRVSFGLASNSAGGDCRPNLRIEDERSGLVLTSLEFEAADLANMLAGRSVHITGTVTIDSAKVGKYTVAHTKKFERARDVADTEQLADQYQGELLEQGIESLMRSHNYGHSVIYWTYHDEPQTDWQKKGR